MIQVYKFSRNDIGGYRKSYISALETELAIVFRIIVSYFALSLVISNALRYAALNLPWMQLHSQALITAKLTFPRFEQSLRSPSGLCLIPFTSHWISPLLRDGIVYFRTINMIRDILNVNIQVFRASTG